MAIYSIESAMKHYRIRNNDKMVLQKKLLKKEDFVGIMNYYKYDFETIYHTAIYTDRESFQRELDVCFELDYPFRFNLVQDREFERERSIF